MCKSNSLPENLLREARQMRNEIAAWRRDIHQHPELSFQEVRTTAFVAEKLRAWGLGNVRTGFGPLKTGVEASIGEGHPCVALRADMDALPIAEKTGLDYSSQNPGVSHACGHDAHTAVLLAAARLLKAREEEIKGRIKFIFQPAEETRTKIFEKPLSGAGYVVRSGAIDDVDALFGMHVWGVFDGGVAFVKPGPTMMASGRFNLKIIGKGTHGASPHLGVDPITAECQIVEGIQTVVSREVSPLEPRLITIGTIHGGTATNIVPQEVELSGTIRAAKEEVVRFMGERLGQVAAETAHAHRCRSEYSLLINGPAVVNDADMVQIVRESAAQVLGTERVRSVEMLTGSEDFREYSSRRPSALWFMGMKRPERGIGQPQHDPCFLVDEEILPDAAAVMAACAFNYLQQKSPGVLASDGAGMKGG